MSPTEPAVADETVAPRRHRKSGWIAGLAVFLIVYIAVLALYASSGRSQGVGDQVAPPPTGVLVSIEIQSMNAAANILNANITISGGSSISEANRDGLTEEVVLVVSPVTGTQQINFPQGETPGTAPAQIIVDGDIEFWPFDHYSTDHYPTDGLSVEAFTITNGQRVAIPATVEIGGRIQGWKFTTTSLLPETAQGAVGPQFYDLKISRSGGALTFAAVMMCVLVVMPILSIFVAAQTYRRKRKVEPAFAGWITAMLFATFSLRAFLPGAPPVGSWVDAVVVLWVAVALVGSLAVYILAWWQTTRPPS